MLLGPHRADIIYGLSLKVAEDGCKDVIEVLEAGLGQHHRHREDAVRRVGLEAVAGVARRQAQGPHLRRFHQSCSADFDCLRPSVI